MLLVVGLTSAWSLAGCSTAETVLQIPTPKQEEDSESDSVATSEEHVDEDAGESRPEQASGTAASYTDSASEPPESPGQVSTEKHVDQDTGENRPEQASGTAATYTGNASKPLESPGQMSTEERRTATLGRAEDVLHEVDEILYQARRNKPNESAAAGNMAGSAGGMPNTKSGGQSGYGTTGDKANTDKPTGETEASEATEDAESGSIATDHVRSRHDYDEDDDIVTRQVCDLARQEKNPDVRKKLEQKCQQLRNE